VSARETGGRLQELLAELDTTLADLERSGESEDVVDKLAAMAELARAVQAEIDRLRREAAAGDESADDAPA
jgi:ABC-type transporter Mla subunit MlaD